MKKGSKKTEVSKLVKTSNVKPQRMITNFNVGEDFWCANRELGGGVICKAQCKECGGDKRIQGC